VHTHIPTFNAVLMLAKMLLESRSWGCVRKSLPYLIRDTQLLEGVGRATLQVKT